MPPTLSAKLRDTAANIHSRGWAIAQAQLIEAATALEGVETAPAGAYALGGAERDALREMGVESPTAALVVAQMVFSAACVARRTAAANVDTLGIAPDQMQHFIEAEAVAQKHRDALLDAES